MAPFLLQISSAAGNIEDIQLGDGSDTDILSPAKLYNIQFVAGSSCNETKCWLSHRLEYFGTSDCQSHFVCPVLQENPCGDFELSLQYPNVSQDICHEARHYVGHLSYNTELEISLWHLDSAIISLSCFMWCTPNGQMPQIPGRSAEDGTQNVDDIIIEIVSYNLKTLM